MKTKYDVGETVLIPCRVKAIKINENGVEYKVNPNGYELTTLFFGESGIHSSACKEKEGETE